MNETIQHIKQIQQSTGFIEDIIYSNLVSFKDEFLNGTPSMRRVDIEFDSGGVLVYSVYAEGGCIYVSYESLVNWINSI